VELPSERVAVIDTIDPQDAATTAKTSAWFDMAKYHEVMAVVFAGAVTGTVDAKFTQATTSGGAGAKDVTGKAVAQMAATDDNKQKLLNLRPEDLDVNGGFRWAKLTVTPTGGTTNLLGAVVLGFLARKMPVTHDTTVAETV
jgi:hypothetical protein